MFLWMVTFAEAGLPGVEPFEEPVDLPPQASFRQFIDDGRWDYPVVPERTRALLSRACAGHIKAACLVRRVGFSDYAQTLTLFEDTCRAGKAWACLPAIALRCTKKRTYNDAQFASDCVAQVSRGCSAGDGYLCSLQANIRSDLGELDTAQAQLWCERGEGLGCLSWGSMIEQRARRESKGGPPDVVARGSAAAWRSALPLYVKACELFSIAGCVFAAATESYIASAGEDERPGAEFLRRACTWGSLDGCDVYARALWGSGQKEAGGALLDILCNKYGFKRSCK